MDPAAPGPSQARPPAVCPPSAVRHLSTVPVPVRSSSTVPVSSTVSSTGAAAHHEAAPSMPSTALGKVVYLVVSLEGSTITEDVLKLAERWLEPFLELGTITPLPHGFVAMGRVTDQARIDRNIKAGQVRMKGVIYTVGQLPKADIDIFNGHIDPADRLASGESDSDLDFSMGDSDSDCSSSPTKRPKSPAQKARKKAYDKRRRVSKRKLSGGSGSNEDRPRTINAAAQEPVAVAATTQAGDPSTASVLTEAPLAPEASSAGPEPATALPPPDTAEVTVPRRKRQRRQRFAPVDFNKVTVEVPQQPAVETFLFRPVDASCSLRRAHPARLQALLKTVGPEYTLRDIRNGGLALDFPRRNAISSAVAHGITSVDGIAVTVSRPKDRTSTAAGVISGVHPDLSTDEVKDAITSDVPVTAVRRLAKPGTTSWVCQLTFAASPAPATVRLFHRSHPVKPYDERPLLCHNCSRYGHPARVCRTKVPRCKFCGRDHQSSACPSPEEVSCCNCKGPHSADSTDCPNRAFQQKVLEVRKQQGLSLPAARAAVTSASRSYAAALKGASQPSQPAATRPPPAATRPAPQHPPAADTVTISKGALDGLFKTILHVLKEVNAPKVSLDLIEAAFSHVTDARP